MFNLTALLSNVVFLPLILNPQPISLPNDATPLIPDATVVSITINEDGAFYQSGYTGCLFGTGCNDADPRSIFEENAGTTCGSLDNDDPIYVGQCGSNGPTTDDLAEISGDKITFSYTGFVATWISGAVDEYFGSYSGTYTQYTNGVTTEIITIDYSNDGRIVYLLHYTDPLRGIVCTDTTVAPSGLPVTLEIDGSYTIGDGSGNLSSDCG